MARPQTPTGLDDELGALVAGEQSHVHGAAFHVGAVLVHDGVQLCVAHCGRGQRRRAAVSQPRSLKTLLKKQITFKNK